MAEVRFYPEGDGEPVTDVLKQGGRYNQMWVPLTTHGGPTNNYTVNGVEKGKNGVR